MSASTATQGVRNVSHEEMLQLSAQAAAGKAAGAPPALIIDVRSAEETKQGGMIPGAVHIPLSDVMRGALDKTVVSDEQFLATYGVPRPPRSSETSATSTGLVFHCALGGRSLKAGSIAAELGYRNVAHYPGGFNLWVQRGGPVRRVA